MDFKDSIKQISEKITKIKEQLLTEEATKNALIMPFLSALGYDVFNPIEVVPELDCDLIKKKGDKIDYAIMKEGEPILLIECKHWQQDLDLHSTQLQKYFVASKAKFGVLTNGIIYRFYTDLEKPNIMDETPFLVVNLENIKDAQIEELKKFHKSYFDIDNIMSSASELKYLAELKSIIKSEFASPSAEMVKLLVKRFYESPVTQKVIDQFTELVKKSFSNYINDALSERLNMAIKSTEQDSTEQDSTEPVNNDTKNEEEQNDQPANRADRIMTTEEELEGFYIVKSILRTAVAAEQITYRDSIRYFAILFTDNNRKTICRLYFNNPNNKRIAIIDDEKKEVMHKIENLDDIYNFQDELIKSAKRYLDIQ